MSLNKYLDILFFVDAASYIDVDDEKWRFYLV